MLYILAWLLLTWLWCEFWLWLCIKIKAWNENQAANEYLVELEYRELEAGVIDLDSYRSQRSLKIE